MTTLKSVNAELGTFKSLLHAEPIFLAKSKASWLNRVIVAVGASQLAGVLVALGGAL